MDVDVRSSFKVLVNNVDTSPKFSRVVNICALFEEIDASVGGSVGLFVGTNVSSCDKLVVVSSIFEIE